MTNNKKTNLKEKGSSLLAEIGRELCALWRLIVTVAQAMAAYILIPQSNIAFKVVGGVLVANAAYMAVVHYTKKS